MTARRSRVRPRGWGSAKLATKRRLIEIRDDAKQRGTKVLQIAFREPVRCCARERADDGIGACAFLSTGCQQRGAVGWSADQR